MDRHPDTEETMATRMADKFKVGDKVTFGRPNGEKTLGTVVKINSATVVVMQDEERGVHRTRAVGTKWKVHPSLIQLVTSASVNTNVEVASVKPKRSEAEIMRDINYCYGALSPENLTCDGELRGSAVVARAQGLRRRLNALQAELGRKVNEDDCWRWYMANR